MSNFLFDNTGSYPQNGVYYTNMFVRTQDIVTGPDGYSLIDPSDISNSRLSSIYQGPGGLTLYYKDANGDVNTLIGATGTSSDAPFIIRHDDPSVPNSQSITSLMGNTGDVLGIASPSTGFIQTVTNIYDNTLGDPYNFQIGYGGNLRNVDASTSTANIAIGPGAVASVINDFTNNIAIGDSTLGSVTTNAYNNTCVGNESVANLTSAASDNVCVGFQSGANLSTACYQNVIIGSQTEGVGGSSFIDDCTIIGFQSTCTNNSNATMIGSSNNCADSNSDSLTVLGTYNVSTSIDDGIVIGSTNTINNSDASVILGSFNGMTGCNDSFLFGNNNTINTCPDCCTIGHNNVISNAGQSVFIGNDNNFTNTVTDVVLIGQGCTGMIGYSNIGIGNSLLLGTTTQPNGSTIIGVASQCNNEGCVGLGAVTSCFSLGAICLGSESTSGNSGAGSAGSMAIGLRSNCPNNYACAFGPNAQVIEDCTFNFAVDSTDGIDGGIPVAVSINNSVGSDYSLLLDGNAGYTGVTGSAIIPGISIIGVTNDSLVPAAAAGQLGLWFSLTQNNFMAQIEGTAYPLIQAGGGGGSQMSLQNGYVNVVNFSGIWYSTTMTAVEPNWASRDTWLPYSYIMTKSGTIQNLFIYNEESLFNTNHFNCWIYQNGVVTPFFVQLYGASEADSGTQTLSYAQGDLITIYYSVDIGHGGPGFLNLTMSFQY